MPLSADGVVLYLLLNTRNTANRTQLKVYLAENNVTYLTYRNQSCVKFGIFPVEAMYCDAKTGPDR
jgi:hypothetical protein